MIISEFLPNPVGKDADGEWMEFFNNGSAPVDLSGWSVKDASEKTFKFAKGTLVRPGEYLKLDYSRSKISINNSGEKLFLYDALGNIVDKAEYSGSAPEGNSLARQGDAFIFTKSPTPGLANAFSAEENAENPAIESTTEKKTDYLQAQVLNSGQGFGAPVLFMCFFSAFVLSAVFIYVLKSAEE